MDRHPPSFIPPDDPPLPSDFLQSPKAEGVRLLSGWVEKLRAQHIPALPLLAANLSRTMSIVSSSALRTTDRARLVGL